MYTYTYIHWNTTQSKRNEILPSPAMWMDQENIMISEISQTDKYYIITYKQNLKNETN